MFDVDAVNADEHLVHKDLAHTFDSCGPNQREPVSAQESARNNHLQIIAVTQPIATLTAFVRTVIPL